MRLIGYTAGGLPGSRILQRLAVPVSDDTVLRAVKCSDKASADDPIRSLGVDDWAWRKGQSYGTILVEPNRDSLVTGRGDDAKLYLLATTLGHLSSAGARQMSLLTH